MEEVRLKDIRVANAGNCLAIKNQPLQSKTFYTYGKDVERVEEQANAFSKEVMARYMVVNATDRGFFITVFYEGELNNE